MTFDEAVRKWDRKHHAALNDVLSYIQKGDSTIIYPRSLYRQAVTTQIFSDFGFSLRKVIRENGKKAFYRYVKSKNT